MSAVEGDEDGCPKRWRKMAAANYEGVSTEHIYPTCGSAVSVSYAAAAGDVVLFTIDRIDRKGQACSPPPKLAEGECAPLLEMVVKCYSINSNEKNRQTDARVRL